jgi:malate permease and related proteins
MFLTIFAVIAPVFLCSLVGFAWVKKGIPFDTPFVSRLVMEVGAPCLIFSRFMQQDVDMDAFREMALAAFVSMLLFGVIGGAVLYVARLDQRTWLPSQIFPNVGNMGLPLCQLAFGDEGLAFGMTYFMVNTVFGFTIGAMITSGKMSVRDLLKTPTFWSVVVTILFLFTGTKPWTWVLNTTVLLGDFTIPLMLVAMGVSLARFQISSVKHSLLISLMRLGMGFAVGVAVATALGLEGTARGITILQSAMPVAVFSYLFAVRYNRSPEEVASTVVISTVLSFLSLPLLLWYVLPAP